MNRLRRYYLSEMAVSNRHGGGLTLQRILQEDLATFERFVHVHEILDNTIEGADRTDVPPVVADRRLDLHPLHRTSKLRSRFDQAAGRVRLRMFHRWSRNGWISRAARHLVSDPAMRDGLWLVVPQMTLAVRTMNEAYKRHPMRYVTWVMDDHPLTWAGDWAYPKRFEPEFRSHLRNAEKVFVISPSMADFYRERFGVDSEVLFGPADSLGELMVDSPAPGPPARLVYFGSIWAWQRDALARLVANLEAVNATLDLYVFHELPTDIQSARVFARNPVPASEVMCRIRQYDGVVIPASFADAERHLTQLNIATKLSESYASGTVPVIIAPPFAAMTQFANRHGGAIVVSDFSDPTQVARLRQIKSRDFRAQLLPLARRVSETECSTAVMRRRWSSVWGAADPAYAGNTDSGRSR